MGIVLSVLSNALGEARAAITKRTNMAPLDLVHSETSSQSGASDHIVLSAKQAPSQDVSAEVKTEAPTLQNFIAKQRENGLVFMRLLPEPVAASVQPAAAKQIETTTLKALIADDRSNGLRFMRLLPPKEIAMHTGSLLHEAIANEHLSTFIAHQRSEGMQTLRLA